MEPEYIDFDFTRFGGVGPLKPSASVFRYATDVLQFGEVWTGWSPEAWSKELRRKADHCDTYRPDIADYYRRWADDIDAKLGRAPA